MIIANSLIPRTEADIQESVKAAMASLNPVVTAPPQPVKPINNSAGQDITEEDLDDLFENQSVPEPKAKPIPQPDAKGEFLTPAEGAKFMAGTYQIPQIPLRGKAPFFDEWQDKGTLDFEQIDSWYAEYRCNFGSIAKAVPGGKFVVEVDSPEVSKRIRKAGVDFSSKVIIESRPGRGHRWCVQSDESIQLSNISQSDVIGGDFSVRVSNQQCVSPGSINPISGKQYRVVSHGVIAPASSEEIQWLKSQKISKADKKETPRNAAGLIPHGSIHGYMLTLAGKLRRNGLTSEEIEPILLRKVHEECQPPIDNTKVKAMAYSIGNFPEGSPASEMVLTSAINTDESEEIQPDEPLPEFPRFTGSLAELSDAICPDIPWEFKFMAATTHFGLIRSGIDVLENNEHLNPRFYTCFIKEPGWGKTAAISELRRAMAMISSNYATVSSIDSAPALVDELKDQEKRASLREITSTEDHVAAHTPGYIPTARVLLDPDEMRDLFEKAKVTSNSRNPLMTELLKLYETNRTGNRARATKKGKIEVNNAHLAILGGAVPEGYESMWVGTGGASLGLQSRMVLVTTDAPKMSIEKTPTDQAAFTSALARLLRQAHQPRQLITLDPEALEMLKAWWEPIPQGIPTTSRIDDMVKRVLMVLAITNDTQVIGPDLMGPAIRFGNYLIGCREKFNSTDSYSWAQAFELAIVKVAKKKRKSLTKNEFRHLVNAATRPGGLGAFLQAWNNVVTAGVLKEDGVTHKGTKKYRV